MNFRLAADDLGVTQGAVAQHIRGLETELGVKLFERMPRSVSLTEAGRAYLVEVGRAFEIIAEATTAARQDLDQVTINVTPSFAARWLLPHLQDFRRNFPAIEVSILATESIPDFRSANIDIAIRDGRPPFAGGGRHELLFRRELIAVASPDYLAQRNAVRTVGDMVDVVLLHDMENEWPTFFKSLFGTDSVQVAQNITFNFATLAIDAAIAAQGIALASTLFVAEPLKKGHLVQVFEQSVHLGTDYYIMTPNRSKDRRSARAFWDWLLRSRG